MTGIEILSSEIIYNTILPDWCIFIGVALMAILLPIVIALCEHRREILGILCVVAATGILIASIALSEAENKNDINYIEYKVTIDDSVSMNEFLDKYEIIDQEGKIYTVKERED